MEKLEELYARQSRTVSPHCRWPPAKLSSFQEQQENKDVALLSSSQSSLRTDMMRLQFLSEPVTVYIDLRDARPQKSFTFPDEKQSASDSSDEEETMPIKDEAERRMRNCSGKSLLLQQLRRAHKEASQLLPNMSTLAEKLEDTKEDPESLEKTDSSKINETQHLKVEQETNNMIARKLMRMKLEQINAPMSNCGGNRADLEREEEMEAEK
ncbi:hypothetical protein N325_00969, partial [Colius striatus]